MVATRALLALITSMVLAASLGAAVAHAQDEALDVSVRTSSFDADGTSTIVVSVTGTQRPDVLDLDAFTVTENGAPVALTAAAPVLDRRDVEVVTVLAMDTSSSMAGAPLASGRAAAIDLIDTLTDRGVAVGLLSFDADVQRLHPPTTDANALIAAVSALEARGPTALYDAMVDALAMLGEHDALGSVIVLADGEDTRSDATMRTVIDEAIADEVPITVIALDSEAFDPEALRRLATQTGGSFRLASEVGQLADRFTEAAGDVASQYVLAYRSVDHAAPQLELSVAVATGGERAETSFVAVNPRELAAIADGGGRAALPPAVIGDAGVFARSEALVVGLIAAFLALALVLAVLLAPRGDRNVTRTLHRAVDRPRPDQSGEGDAASRLGAGVVALLERAPRPPGYDERVQTALDRAGWRLRAGEYHALRLVVGTGAGLGLWAVSGSALLGVVAGVLGLMAPAAVMARTTSRRRARFMAQLPDALQLLAGTLKAGYGVLQGLDTVAREVDDPLSDELRRVLTEVRLGLPLQDALDAMADRIGNEDVRWVVVAMTIQRQVGGNLARLLETVAATLRGRDQVRRQIDVLSAEGRLSALILLALPFVVIVYLLLANPGYLLPLFTHQLGLVMVAAAGVLMLVGWWWIRRLIRIEV